MRNYATGHPTAYAAGKLPTMLSRWNGTPGVAVRSMGAGAGWGTTPPQALLGVTANSEGASERYCHGFCALGLYQIPESTLDALASDARVTALLGGASATDSTGAWQTDVNGQVATGLVSLAQDRAALSSALGSAGSTNTSSQWSLMLGVMAYVLGASGAAAALGTAPAAVASVPEATRFGALIRTLAMTRPGQRAWGYPVVRAWQRLATGAALARATGGTVAWFDTGLGADAAGLEDAVSYAAYGGPYAPLVRDVEAAGVDVVKVAGVVSLGSLASKLLLGKWPWEYL